MKLCYVEGKHKLADRWEPRPYIVVKKQPGIPVYVVRSEDGDRERVIHRNLLAQCMFFPVGSKHLAGEETDMEEVSGMDSIVSEGEEEVIEPIVSGDSGMITQCPNVELPYVASEECEQDEHQLEETVYGKEEDKEQTPLKFSNPDPPT